MNALLTFPQLYLLYNFTFWEKISFGRSPNTFRSLSVQTKAEQAAWEVAKSEGLDLVTINPNFVMGPAISPTAGGTSIGYFKVGHAA